MDILDRLESHWYPERRWYRIKPGTETIRPDVASEHELSGFEVKYGGVLPIDFHDYFLHLNGTDDAGDDELIRFWPLRGMRPVDSKGFNMAEAGSYFYFADFLIESHYYAIYLGNNPRLQNQVILPDFPGCPSLGFSFTEFLELYLRNDPKLFGN
jgi:hypothetical protein